jgi:hypothetical protein
MNGVYWPASHPDRCRQCVVSTQLERLAEIAAELGDQTLAYDARAEHDRLLEARFFVACLGQFKRGKSSGDNSSSIEHRVENDLKERTRESRWWLEGQIRPRLVAALHSAERAVSVATEKQHLSETEIQQKMDRVHALREEVALMR